MQSIGYGVMEFTIHLAATASIFLAVAALLRIAILRAGMLLASAAFPFALGSYVLAILYQLDGRSTGFALLLAPLIAAGCGAAIAAIASRMAPATVFTATLLFQALAYLLVYNWYEPNAPIGSLSNLTNGAQGITLFGANIFGVSVTGYTAPLLIVPLCGCVWLWCQRLETSVTALGLDAHRIDPVATSGLGVAGSRILIGTLAVVHALLAFLGVLYATVIAYVDPTMMSVQSGLFLFALGLMGVFGRILGPTLAVVLLVLFPEILRIFLVSEETASAIRQGLTSAGLLAALLLHGLWRPRPGQRREIRLYR